MINFIKFQAISKNLREAYAAANQPSSTCRDRLKLCYVLGEEVSRIENVFGKEEALLLAFSCQLYAGFPDAEEHCFELSRLKKMRRFYMAYRDFMDITIWDAICKVKWWHHIYQLCKLPDAQIRRFYLLQSAANGWTSKTLANKIKNDYYGRRGQMLSNFDTTLFRELSEQAPSFFMNRYCLEFIKTRPFSEKALEIAIKANMGEFLEEFGPGFSFNAWQYRAEWEDQVYFFDLVLYHKVLQCYIIVDLKLGKCKPEYIGKMNRYLNVANQVLKNTGNNAIGLLLCESANAPIVKSDLTNSRLPIGVATYRIGA